MVVTVRLYGVIWAGWWIGLAEQDVFILVWVIAKWRTEKQCSHLHGGDYCLEEEDTEGS